MQFILLLSFLLTILSSSYSLDIIYNSDNNKIRETITTIKNGISYNFNTDKKTYQILMLTNENHATVSFTNITKKETNAFYIFNGNLITIHKGKRKNIELHNLELILLPEVQLQNFIQNKELTNMQFITFRLSDLKPYIAQANKIPTIVTNIKNIPHTIVEISYENISPKTVKFIYYYNPEGIASKKEGYFIGAKKPQLNLMKQ